MIKFLLRHDADPHVEDINGLDSCDKGKKKQRYVKIAQFQTNCKSSVPNIRTKFNPKDHENKSYLRSLRRGLKDSYKGLTDIKPQSIYRKGSLAISNEPKPEEIISK